MPDNVGVNRQRDRQQNLVVKRAADIQTISVIHRVIGSDDVDGYKGKPRVFFRVVAHRG